MRHRFPVSPRSGPSFKRILAALGAGVLAAVGDASAAPSVSITSLPAYGANGSLVGRVEGIDPATHRVATYLYVDGAGWWTKPSDAMRTVPIAPDLATPDASDGSFSALVTTGGVDPSAILYCVAVVPSDETPPLALGAERIPEFAPIARSCAERTGRTIEFSGRLWGVKEAPLPVGPGANRFSLAEDAVFVDTGDKLHLTIRQDGDAWIATEVYLLAPLGYGTYEFTTESDLASLDADATFGAFTWDPYGDGAGPGRDPNREIDFEASRWGNPLDPNHAQAVVQPYALPGNLVRFGIGAGALRWRIHWLPERILFEVLDGADLVYAWSYDGVSRPDEGRAVFHLNLWPSGADLRGPVEVVVGEFTYTPEPVAAMGALAAFATLVALRARVGRRISVRARVC